MVHDKRNQLIFHDDVVRESLKDPAYRKHYMRYHIRISIAQLVKDLREAKGMTQKQLADLASIPQSQIARLEGLADERIPGFEQLIKILAALDAIAYLDIVPRSKARRKRISLVPEGRERAPEIVIAHTDRVTRLAPPGKRFEPPYKII